jgi:hypothetical protein
MVTGEYVVVTSTWGVGVDGDNMCAASQQQQQQNQAMVMVAWTFMTLNNAVGYNE